MPLHPKVEEAFEQIDAAIFSGDTFFTEDTLQILTEYMERWQRQLPHLVEMSKQ